MTPNLDLIWTISGGLVAALVFGYGTHRIGLSPIVGYLIAGVIIGPATPGFVADYDTARQLAELGVILLLFGVGLHFHLSDLMSVRRVVLPGALSTITIATVLGTWLAHAVGWSTQAAVVFGLSLPVTSTVVLIRVLTDRGVQHTQPGRIATGWGVADDIFTVLVLVLLSAYAPAAGSGNPNVLAIGGALALAFFKMLLLMAMSVGVGQRLVPALLGFVARTRSRELFTLTVLVIALGLAVIAAQLFGASMALGAFLAGTIVGQSRFSARAAAEAMPMRDAFAVLFFVSIGMLFDPKAVFSNGAMVLGSLAIVMLGKPFAGIFAVLSRGYPIQAALTVGGVLGQLGEFSFILAGLGHHFGILPETATTVLITTAVISISINPVAFGGALRLGNHLARRQAARAANDAETFEAVADEMTETVVLVGFGPVGQVLANILRHEGIQPVVIEFNPETVARLTEAGIPAVYGDVAQREVLEQAGIASARSLIFTADGPFPPLALTNARELNPDLLVMARTRYLAELPILQEAGANRVVASELEVAWAMAEHLLISLGASPEELDREHDRIRSTLGNPPADRDPIADLLSDLALALPAEGEGEGDGEGDEAFDQPA